MNARLLAGVATRIAPTYDQHLALHGPLDPRGDLTDELDRAGLRGRGGAAFPTGTKLRAVAEAGGRPLVVANAVEGEPVSGKDRALLRVAPHLVLDGAVAACRALGARDAIVAIGDRTGRERAMVEAAIAQRGRKDGRVTLRTAAVESRFVAGEETALVRALGGREAKPSLKPPYPFERGLDGAPTLVANAETLAHVALIARFGAGWFRSAGTSESPGTALVTIGGAVVQPGVHEIELGTTLDQVQITGPLPAPVWQAFNWGQANWGVVANKLYQQDLAWHLPVVFKQMALRVTVTAGTGLVIGAFRYGNIVLGYRLETFKGYV